MIVKLGNPVLRKQAARLQLGAEAQQLARRLFQQAKLHGAWGVAAPQIGVSSRLFVMAQPRLKRRTRPLPSLGDRFMLEAIKMGVHYTAIVNPEIVHASAEMEAAHEQCLSIPGVSAPVPRHKWIDAKFETLDGRSRSVRLFDHPARVFQHELDHLDGTVFLDRILDTKDIIADTEVGKEYVHIDGDVDEQAALGGMTDGQLQGLELTPGSYEHIFIYEEEQKPLEEQYA